ncbi:SDR family NAD(P)-dependent oxidoreductase [Micromonospora sp. NPDC094482]|uniref:SDR family NAD(P)-dependent oxidoreductase n=1 Tax=Micromonospora sp. NPDC094482 TaxID=3155081 RepID=UPI0033326419
MGQLDGKVAVVTGASEGIGFASALRFAEEGAYVYLTGRRKPELDEAVARIGAARATGVRGDVTDLADLDQLVATIGADGRRRLCHAELRGGAAGAGSRNGDPLVASSAFPDPAGASSGGRRCGIAYPWSALGRVVSFDAAAGLVCRTSRACSAARVMLSLMKSRKRATFSRRVAAGVCGPRTATPWRAVSTSWSLARALAIVAW